MNEVEIKQTMAAVKEEIANLMRESMYPLRLRWSANYRS
jgi:hypothetical protein